MELEKVGPYLIEGKLGSGGMGTVYKGQHEETGVHAAVKVLAPSLSREEGFVARFSREVESLRKLSNPYVVEFFESDVDGDLYYFAMEYVDGETLTQRLRREKRIPWREVVEISTQICIALKSAHDAGVIHRDLKPSNLMLTQDGKVKLTDFGVAQVFASAKLTVTGGIIGTAEYMSPEQAQGRRVTKKSDLYSLGAVMYVMLTGRPPFRGKTILEVIQKHKYGQFDHARTIVPEIPHWLDELVCQLLEKDPEKRVPDAYVLSRRLQEIVKKVELSQSEMTMSIDPDSDAGASTTVAINPEQQANIQKETQVSSASRASAHFPHESGGTLMREMMRAEIEEASKKTPVAQFFDNTWVLIVLLICVLFGFYLWYTKPPSPVTPEEEVVDSTEINERLRFVDLDWKRSLKRPEAERIYARGVQQFESGQTKQAQETMTALLTLLKSSGENPQLVDRVQERLDELNGAQEEFISEYVEQAQTHLDGGQLAEAQTLISSMNTLYGNDSRVRGLVEQYNQAVKTRQNNGQ
ncbi:Serine/threonine-protein kinase PknL [Polystyrenella longa]|uniref:non-specific serine/threonine protein kinase n=1 Tax=Polystyrenella longa TaxID=2528007 RepID=A0A518CSP1_9PLAN|nr:serine/threonine-protein kinase [Polystyrenella longa]QDU82251.1 Serine/threonine-protein kinase PknL [Polystyrenella longa]